MPAWNKHEIAFLKQYYCEMNNAKMANILRRTLSSIDGKMTKLGLKRPTDVAKKMSGSTRFKKGQIPWNKGVKGLHFSPATEFKKGSVPANTLYNGAIRVRYTRKRPYKWVRVAPNHWRLYHQLVWEKNFGAIPDDKILRFKDGDSLNVVIENLELVTRQSQLRDNYDPEKVSATNKANWASGKRYENEEYIASLLFRKDKDMRSEAIKHKNLIDLKRNQLKLNRELKYGT